MDFTPSRLGSGIPVVRAEMDLAAVARHAVDEAAAANPTSVINITTSGDVHGKWDASRVSQVLANLLGNAVQHGTKGAPITVSVTGVDTEVILAVHNAALPIPAAEIPRLFDPVERLGPGGTAESFSGNLGLGLSIADRIVAAHGGSIDVTSSAESGTCFTARLPRWPNAGLSGWPIC